MTAGGDGVEDGVAADAAGAQVLVGLKLPAGPVEVQTVVFSLGIDQVRPVARGCRSR